MLVDPERVRSAVKAVGEFCLEAVSWQLLHASMLDAEPHDERHDGERRTSSQRSEVIPASASS
jgi:hypothetical protein